MILHARLYITADAHTEIEGKNLRGVLVHDPNTRPYVTVTNAAEAERYADVTIEVSTSDKVILRTHRTLGEYTHKSAKGILTLSDDDNPDRYNIVIFGGNYNDVVALYRAIHIGSILPDVSYDGVQMKDPAHVKLDKIKELLEVFKPADPTQQYDMTFYNNVAMLLKG